MASAASLRCLARPCLSRASTTSVLPVRSFSTTSPLLETIPPPPVRSRRSLPTAMKKSFKKKRMVAATRKPAPGERKAWRKRVQLSNNNALPVHGHEILSKENIKLQENAGKLFELPDQVIDKLRALEAFKATQSWGLFRKPNVLVRDETVELAQKMADAAEKGETLSSVIMGPKGSGKSLLLLQAMSYALMNDWVVIHVPEAQDLTTGSTEFAPIPDTDPMIFGQPVWSLKMLDGIYKANKVILDHMPVQTKPAFTQLKDGLTVGEMIRTVKEVEYGWQLLETVWQELTLPGRPPVLFALDHLSYINRVSDYRDPSYNPVHSHQLWIVKTFVDHLSQISKLPNGGAILAATSESNPLHHPSQELALGQLLALQAGLEGENVPKANPWEKSYDDRVYKSLAKAEVVNLKGVSRAHARTLMEYWGASGMVKSEIDNRVVAEKWALGGSGIVGEIENATLMTMRM